MKLLLIRHADPDYPNNTLTAAGFAEAEALGEYYRHLSFDEAYCSPLNRAKLTADAFLRHHPGQTYEVKDWLKEFDVRIHVPYTEEEVLSWDFLPFPFAREEAFFSGDKFFKSDWLSSEELHARYREATEGLDEILARNGYRREGRAYRAVASNERTLLFFCHFGMMSVLLSHLFNIPYVLLAQHFECQPTGVTTVVTEERIKGEAHFRCLRYSDVTHLTVKGIEPAFSGRFCETFERNERH